MTYVDWSLQSTEIHHTVKNINFCLLDTKEKKKSGQRNRPLKKIKLIFMQFYLLMSSRF